MGILIGETLEAIEKKREEGVEHIDPTVFLFDFNGAVSFLRHGFENVLKELIEEHAEKNSLEIPHDFFNLSKNSYYDYLVDFFTFNKKNIDFSIWTRFYEKCLEFQQIVFKNIQGKKDVGIVPFFREFVSYKPKMINFYAFDDLFIDLAQRDVDFLEIDKDVFDGVYGDTSEGGVFSGIDFIKKLCNDGGLDPREIVLFSEDPFVVANASKIGLVTFGMIYDRQNVNLISWDKRLAMINAGADFVMGSYFDYGMIYEVLKGKMEGIFE